MTALTEADVAAAAAVLRAEMAAKTTGPAHRQARQPFVSDVLELIVSQAIVPILVAVTSTQLSDVLKERRLSHLKKRDAQQLAQNLVGKEIRQAAAIDLACVAELEPLLAPMGFSTLEIEGLVARVRHHVTLAQAGDPGPAAPSPSG